MDVAGGHGLLLATVLRRHKRMRGVLFDLPHVAANAAETFTHAGIASRVRIESGDFFTELPSGADAIIMKHIIHDWDDERAAQILRTIRPHLSGKPGGRIILLEAVLQPGNQPDLGKMIDLEMLMMPGGKERSEAEFASLFKSAGYALTCLVPTKSPLSIIETKVA